MKSFLAVLVGLGWVSVSGAEAPWRSELEAVRKKGDLPALGAVLVWADGARELAVVGERKRGSGVAVTEADQWHLGSDTKAMTAVLAALAVKDGSLRWETSLGEVFKVTEAEAPVAAATLDQLLRHRAGVAANLSWGDYARAGEAARREVVAELAKIKVRQVGTYSYSNTGYVLAGAMVEAVGQASWESQLQQRVFTPLGITSAGFGGLGTPGEIDQPWPHAANGKPLPKNGPAVDNPPVMGPAGTVHLNLADGGLWLQEWLRGLAGKGTLLDAETYRRLATVQGEGNYAAGWLVLTRKWGGRVLTHAGSNTMNFCVIWLCPEKGFALLVVCNQGGDDAEEACDEAAGLLIKRALSKAEALSAGAGAR